MKVLDEKLGKEQVDEEDLEQEEDIEEEEDGEEEFKEK